MFLLHGESKYIDVVEKIMYNGFISGLGLDGKSFFYTNAMQVKNSFSHSSLETGRSGWFPCSCCPTNVVRLLPSVPGYVYAQKDDELFINLFISSKSSIHILGKDVEVIQQNNYPWDGKLEFNIHTSAPVAFSLKIRIPGWALNSAIPSDLYSFENPQTKYIPVTINGKETEYKIENGYAVFNRKWSGNELVELRLPMEVKRVTANKKVLSDIGKVALQRGPIIFCAEGIDNNGRVSNFVLPDKAVFNTEFKQDLLNGVITIKSSVPGISIDKGGQSVQTVMKSFTAIPYYAWANRGKGEMIVWFPEKIKDIDILSSE
jgi:hypothetical protein